MIGLLAPTTVEGSGADTVIVEMSQETFRALAVATEIAFEDETVIPDHMKDTATELWNFFHPQSEGTS